MKLRRFNPSDYENLNNVRNKIIKYASNYVDLDNKKILDVGCGSGIFTESLGIHYPKSYIKAIDIVESYIKTSKTKHSLNNVNYFNESFFEIESKFDVITFFLSMTELKKCNTLNKIFSKIEDLLTSTGSAIICEEFEDDYSEDVDVLGMKILKKLGYNYFKIESFEKEIKKHGFSIVETKIFDNKLGIIDKKGSKLQIFYENKLNEFDNTIKYKSEDIWNEFKDEIALTKGTRTYNKIRMYLIQKENKFISTIEKKSKKGELNLIYNLNEVKDNIKYYTDFNIDNIGYIFPIKTFPSNRVINIFDNNNFCFDVSNKNELDLVKNKNIFFSDPSGNLKNKDSLRININGISSHFGKEYDNISHNIFHFHVSDNKDKKTLKLIINQLKRLDYSKTRFLDIGGGYYGLSYFEIYSFLNSIRQIVPIHVKILLEAGSLWFKNAGYLVCKVTNITKVRNRNFVFLNASRELHAKWSVPKVINMPMGDYDYILCGATCYEGDLFAHIKTRKLKVDDVVIFNNIDAYSYSFNKSFNGIEKAKVIFYE